MRKKGNFIFPVNFEPTGQSILDARLKVPTKEDLTTGYQDGNYYPKMVVTVEDEDAQYILSKEDPTQIDNWKKLNGGEGFSTISWDNSSNMNNYKDEGIYTISGVRSNSGDNMPISNYNTNGYIGGTLIINKTPEDPETKEYIISQNLVLANKVGGETKEYIRSCIVKNQIETWTPWKESNMIQLFGEKASGLASDVDINAAIDNGQYMGVYTGSTLMSPGSTFIMTVINNYAANAQTGQPNNRQVTQIFFYTPLSTNGKVNPSNIVKRDGIGGESITWGDIEQFGSSDTSNNYIFNINESRDGQSLDWGNYINTNDLWNEVFLAYNNGKNFYANVNNLSRIIPLHVSAKGAYGSVPSGTIYIDYFYLGSQYQLKSQVVYGGNPTTTITNTESKGVGQTDPNSGGTGEIFNNYSGDSFGNKATGDYAHAEGSITTASGQYSHAENFATTASGIGSHAEGNGSSAIGANSHAEGNGTKANGDYSHSEGNGTVTNNNSEHAQGTYNMSNTGSDDSQKTIHSVGIGSQNNNKNAHEVMVNGDHYIYGIGSYDGTNYAAAKTLQEVVNGKQDTLVSGTSIKTVNGQSILGEGNIEIQGSGGGIADAPSDGNKYVRQNGNWVQETSVDTSAFATKEYINQLLTLEIVE